MLYKSIRYFLEAARCLNFSQAARQCFISQQTMTWHIAQLESEFGVKLFIRSTRSVQLTKAGIYLRDEFTHINDEISQAVSNAKSFSALNRSVINIGFFQAFDHDRITLPVMQRLEKKYPDIYFNLHLLNLRELLLELSSENLDIIVTTSYTWKSWSTLNVHPLRHFPFLIAISKNHPAAKDKITTSVLSGLTLLTTEQPSQYNSESIMRTMPKWRQSLPHKDYLHMPDISSLLINLQMGRGFSILTDELAGIRNNPNLLLVDPARISSALSNIGSDMLCCYKKGSNNAQLKEYSDTIQEMFTL